MMSRRRRADRKRLVGVSLVATVLSAGLAYLFLRIGFMLDFYSVEGQLIERFMRILFAIAGIFLGTIATFFGYSLLFFRRRPGDQTDAAPTTGHLALEVVWTLIPLAVVIALSVYGAIVLERMEEPALAHFGATMPEAGAATSPEESELQVNVLAFRFGWQFEYPEYNIQSFELYLPVDRRVVFSIQSRDVVHSFWVPEFGPKQDAVPGMTTVLRITPTRIGQYTVRCAELCGSGHTFMTAPCSVVSSGDFDKWVQAQQQQ